MFGVNLMVHSWVTVQSAPAPLKSRRGVQRSSVTYNWKLARGFFFLIAFLILFSGFTLLHTSASTGVVTPAASNEIVITVDSGDTLWQLAKSYKKESMDTREAVHLLTKRNGLTSSELHSGQALIIPTRIVA
jgi:cell division protein YceG involved in septum cleavage